MSNGIQMRENEHNSIIMLAAQRELYSEAKKLCNVDVVISVGLPILLAIMQSVYDEKNWIIPFISALIIASIILGIVLTNIVKKKKEVAATIQQLFDVYVFQLPWDSKLFGRYYSLSNEIIIYSKKIIRNTSDEMQFVNWYTPIADQLPLLKGITVCQAENCQWDKSLRMRYKNTASFCITMISIIIIGIGIINNQSVQLVFLRLATIIPMIRWLAFLVNNLKHDILRLEILEKYFSMESEKNMDDVLNVQKSIFEHRKDAELIPDVVYRLFMKKDEQRAREVASLRRDTINKRNNS